MQLANIFCFFHNLSIKIKKPKNMHQNKQSVDHWPKIFGPFLRFAPILFQLQTKEALIDLELRTLSAALQLGSDFVPADVQTVYCRGDGEDQILLAMCCWLAF